MDYYIININTGYSSGSFYSLEGSYLDIRQDIALEEKILTR